MTKSRIGLSLAPIAMLIAAPAYAVPEDVAEMRQIIASEFGGNVNAYVEEERSDFRRMGCRGRTDLLQALFDDGLVLNELTYETHWRALICAYRNENTEAAKLLITPDLVTAHEQEVFDKSETHWLGLAIYENEYDQVRLWLQNGVHAYGHDDDYAALTREEHLLLAAHRAVDGRKEHAIRAFQDSGFGYLLDAARNKANIDYVRARAGKGGGGLGGLLGAIGGAALGAQLGGLEGAAAGALMSGERAGRGDGDQTSNGGPLPLPTRRADLGAQLDLARQPQGGLRISAIASEGPAQAAGMMVGDVITSIAGVPVNSRGSFYVATGKAFDLETFEIGYRRGGTEQTLQFHPSASVLAAEEKMAPVAAGSDANAAAGKESDTEAMLAELERLADLHDRGILSDEEFETMKARILEGT